MLPSNGLDSIAELMYLAKISPQTFETNTKLWKYDFLGEIRENKIFNSTEYPSSWFMLLDILFLGAHHIYYTSFDNYEWYDGRGSYFLLDSRNRSIINDRAQVQNTGSVWWNEQIRLPGKITKNHHFSNDKKYCYFLSIHFLCLIWIYHHQNILYVDYKNQRNLTRNSLSVLMIYEISICEYCRLYKYW